MQVLKDFSLSTIVAGFVAVLVGYTSSAVLVFEAAAALGASPAEIGSWIGILGIAMGVSTIALSLRYRMPVLTAWSTPGAAMLITTAAGVSMPEAIGAFILCGAMITFAGFSGLFERGMNRIPVSLAAGLLAGVLLQFGIGVFTAMQDRFELAFAMFVAYLLARRVLPRYAVVAALVTGLIIAISGGLTRFDEVPVRLLEPVFIMPSFSWTAAVGIALPLFVVTMASQNVPGVATARTAGSVAQNAR